MALTLREIANRCSLALDGDGSVEVVGLCGISDNLPRHLSFLKSERQLAAAAASRMEAFIVPPGIRIDGKVHLYHDNPELAMARAADLFLPADASSRTPIHPSAVIAPTARLHPSASIGALATVGERTVIGAGTRILPGVMIGDDVAIGNDCTVHGNCVIRERSVIGNRVVLQPGVVIGGDGYGFVWDGEQHVKIPQLGNVIIEDDVEIGANSTVDRGRFTATRIGRGTKIDNLVMVAHNVRVGEHSLLVAQSGISGSTRIGNQVTLAGQVGVAGHLEIADNVTVLGQSMVSRSIRQPGVYAGSPARKSELWQRAVAAFYRAARLRNDGTQEDDLNKKQES